MKTYTLTWHSNSFYGCGYTLHRCRYDSLCLAFWNSSLPNDKILQFMNFVMLRDNFRRNYFRLIKCGHLVARSATYQGV